MTKLHPVAMAALVLVAVAPAARAQKWKDIGTTSSGNVVSVDPKSIRHDGKLVSATVRVVFTPPVKAQRGMWASSKTTATFDCSRRYLAAKENVYYSDAKSTKVLERSVNKIPGFGPALGGSLGGIATDYLCAK
ncbi:MAG: surface-adhesin E family protein [Gemmatimonadaceae bacterium]